MRVLLALALVFAAEARANWDLDSLATMYAGRSRQDAENFCFLLVEKEPALFSHRIFLNFSLLAASPHSQDGVKVYGIPAQEFLASINEGQDYERDDFKMVNLHGGLLELSLRGSSGALAPVVSGQSCVISLPEPGRAPVLN